MMPLTSTMGCRFPRDREQVVVHGNHHGNEDHAVVEHMKLYSWEDQLQNAGWHWRMEKVMVNDRLVLQQRMLDVMPELDIERYAPPLMGSSSESLTQYPDTDEHDQRVAIVQDFHLDRPGINHAEHSQRFGARPSHNINLIRLK